MVRVPSSIILLGLAFCALAPDETMAQRFDESGVVYESARNKIGLIRYCRKSALLDPAIANQAVAAVETGLRTVSVSDVLTREQGDRAQRAGEDGYWDAGRTRDIAGIAALFRTTPAELCKEWANETVRSQEPGRPVPITTIAIADQPIVSIEPSPQVEPAPAERAATRVGRPPALATTLMPAFAPAVRPAPASAATATPAPAAIPAAPAVLSAPASVAIPTPAPAVLKTVRPAPLPPLPERAPFLPTKGELASLQRTTPTRGSLAPPIKVVRGDIIRTTAAAPGDTPPPSGQALSATPPRLKAAEPLPRERTATAASAAHRPYDGPNPLWIKWPFNRVDKPEYCRRLLRDVC
jgi:hypothetical protein